MAKREHAEISLGGSDDSKSKRRKQDTSYPSAGATSSGHVNGASSSVKEQGLKLWQTVKDHTNKEGRLISFDFLKKPPKKVYPDYYQLIAKPIALEDIKKRLELNGYPSLEAVRQDFELCFTNAKTYNMKDSAIWKDAKELLKVANKTYHKLNPSDEAGKESKPPSMHHMLKSRLKKVVEKTDDNGRVISAIFMELPSKKDWPMYYDIIKQPQCLDNIFKRLKHKEYKDSAEFAADVELVFSNATTFNQEHTVVWDDAMTLRDTFRQLMSDLPPPHSLAQYTSPSATRIKIKVPGAGASSSTQAAQKTGSSPSAGPSSSPTITLRVPPSAPVASASKQPATAEPSKPLAVKAEAPREDKATASAKAATSVSSTLPAPTVAPASLPVAKASTPAPAPPPKAPALPRPAPVPQVIPQQPTFVATSFHPHYPNANYAVAGPSSIPAPIPVTQTPARQVTPAVPPYSGSSTPAPQLSLAHQLRSITISVEPSGRSMLLDHRLGVKSFALELVRGETGFYIQDVTFMAEQEEEESSEEEEEEEEEDPDIDMETGKKKKRGRGRPPKKPAPKPKPVRPAKKKPTKPGNLQVSLNGSVLAEAEGEDGAWLVELSSGYHIIEVGEQGGMIWKLYAERVQ